MMRKLLPLAIAGALMSTTALAADVGVAVNVAGVPVEKKVEVKTTGIENAAAHASEQGQAGLDKAAAAKARAEEKADKKMKAGKDKAATLDAMTGLNTGAAVEQADGKLKEGKDKAGKAQKKAEAAKAEADAKAKAATDAVNNAPAEANKKLQDKINATGFGTTPVN